MQRHVKDNSVLIIGHQQLADQRWRLRRINLQCPLTLVLPLTPVARVFEFTPLPLKFVPLLAVIVALYVFCAELTKAWFYKRESKNAH